MVKGLDNILSVRVDFNFSDPCYVLQLAAAQHGAADATVAAALSNNVIKLYHHHVADLQQISSLEGHSDRITDVHIPLQQAPSVVLSSSDDGTVRVWDSRSATEAEKYICTNEEVYSCTCTENVVAAGTNGKVWFWDRRQRKMLQTMSDTHMDMVTVAAFHPLQPHLFFSGSDDGLIAAFDFTHGLSEDDGFVAALNVRNAPVDMQFFGAGKGKLWCRTATETMHFWDWGGSIAQQAQDYMAVEEDPDACVDSCDMMDAREQLNAALKQDPGLFKGQVDYLVGCHEGEAERLYLAAGSSQGSVALFEMELADNMSGCSVGKPTAQLCGGHSDVVRSVLVHGEVLITGGEDSRVCVWGDAGALEEHLMAASDSGGAAPSAGGEASERHKPY